MSTPSYQDYCWLISDEGCRWLAAVADRTDSLVAQTRFLRKQISVSRAHLVLEQIALRRRATRKFPAGAHLFFTARGLEQATDQMIALFKSTRFAGRGPVVDLCCGIGGDLLQLARVASVTAVDCDPISTLLAAANCRACGAVLGGAMVQDARQFDLRSAAAWHIDPDRRAAGHRTAQPCWSEPSVEAVDQMRTVCPHAALKLAPAAQVPAHWEADTERQWIGSGRECRQQVVWCGGLAHQPGCRSAVVVGPAGGGRPPFVGQPMYDIDLADNVGRYVFEPHATVLAAGLGHTLAHHHQLRALGPDVAYYTSDQLVTDPLLRAFEVDELLPLDLRRLRAALRQRQIGHLEVKKRNADIDPDAWRRRLKCSGSESATLLVAPWQGHLRAILARSFRTRD